MAQRKHAKGTKPQVWSRIPKEIVKRLERAADAEGSTVSQLIRSAVIRELKRRKVA
jgi:hypothetical protein